MVDPCDISLAFHLESAYVRPSQAGPAFAPVSIAGSMNSALIASQ